MFERTPGPYPNTEPMSAERWASQAAVELDSAALAVGAKYKATAAQETTRDIITVVASPSGFGRRRLCEWLLHRFVPVLQYLGSRACVMCTLGKKRGGKSPHRPLCVHHHGGWGGVRACTGAILQY